MPQTHSRKSSHIEQPHIVILGAGLIGSYVGGLISSAGHHVSFLGRTRPDKGNLGKGVSLTSYDNRSINVNHNQFHWSDDDRILEEADFVLVCVKSTGTEEAGKLIDRYCRQDATVFSFQNGIGNAEALGNLVGQRKVLSAMVGFNVIRPDPNRLHFHKSTEGYISIEAHPASRLLLKTFQMAGEPAELAEDIEAVLWGKLLLNLNNAVNVLSGLPLKRQLETRNYRRILAYSIEEALKALNRAGVRPAKIGKVKASLLPFLLRLPDFLFKRIAAGMLKIDEEARSSMWEDYQAQKPSEINFLNGAICDLGEKNNIPTPVNDLIVAMVKDKFEQRPVEQPDSEALLHAITGAASN